MSATLRPSRARLATASVLVLLAAGLPASGLADPCAGTSGFAAAGDRVCRDGRTLYAAAGEVRELAAGAHAGVAFLTFSVEGDRLALLGRGEAWTGPVPASQELRLRTPDLAPAEGPFVLLQLATPMLPEWAAALAAAGATVHAYVPDNAFLVRAPDASPLAALPFVTRMAALGPLAKLEPGLAEEPGRVLVNVLTMPGFAPAREAVLGALPGLGAVLVEEAPEVERLTLDLGAARLPALAALPEVLWVDRASLDAEQDMDLIRHLTGAAYLQLPPLRDFRGQDVVGMVMDAGLETTHPDFQHSLLAVDGTNSPHSHGTAVYGIVFGSGAGNALAVGMAPEAKGVFAWYSSGQTRYAHAQHLRDDWGGVFQTHSWGRGVPKDNTYDSYSNENDRVVFDLDVLMLQSMSNCGPLCARREAMAKNILSIGAAYHKDDLVVADDAWKGIPPGSSRASTGPAADGRMKPELIGPYDAITTTALNGGYTTSFGGTSGATPVVAGAVALTNQLARAGLFGTTGTPSPAAVKALLMASAEPLLPYQVLPVNNRPRPAELFERDVQGWGHPSLGRLHQAGAGGGVALLDEDVGLATGQSQTISVLPPPGAAELRVTLAWTDVPANPGASKTLVNDLDLEVRDAAGNVYLGNAGLRSGLWSSLGGAADRTNNFEHVFLPAPGPVTITVRGAAVNLDGDPTTPALDQPFALVALTDHCLGGACPGLLPVRV